MNKGQIALCVKDVFMYDENVFTTGREYVFIDDMNNVIDDSKTTHTISGGWFNHHFKLQENMTITHDQDIILTQDTALNEAQARIAILTEALQNIAGLPLCLNEDEAFDAVGNARRIAEQALEGATQC